MKNRFTKYFKNVVIETSKLSTCVSKQVGAVLVRDNRILAISYNGVASNKKHCNELFDIAQIKNTNYRQKHHQWSIKNELHAEENLLAFCAKSGIATNNSQLFIQVSPCISCAKIILAAGIKEVYYIHEYDYDCGGLEFLKEHAVKCKKM